jgi:hypothetical protein
MNTLSYHQLRPYSIQWYDNGWWFGKDLEGSGHDLMWGTLLPFWLERPRTLPQTTLWIASLSVEIWTQNLPSMKKKWCPFDSDIQSHCKDFNCLAERGETCGPVLVSSEFLHERSTPGSLIRVVRNHVIAPKVCFFEGFWWRMTLRTTGFLDFVHRPEF